MPAYKPEIPAASFSDPPDDSPMPEPLHAAGLRAYAWTLVACAATALIATPMYGRLEAANIVMLFLLNVVLVGMRLGRRPAILASVLGVALFDFFFVPPRFTFAIGDLQYLVVFAVMLVVGLIAGQMTASLRFQATAAAHGEARARALYEFARELSGVLQCEQILDITRSFIRRTFNAQAVMLLPDAAGRLQPPASRATGDEHVPPPASLDIAVAQWAFDHTMPAGMSTNAFPHRGLFYLPLLAPMRARGVLAIRPEGGRWLFLPEQRQHLDTFAMLAAIALERVHYIEVAQRVQVRMESERLRNSLLSALSHDLRTPLTSLVGLSESLALSTPALSPAQRSMADALHQQALRMSTLVANLLDMARITSGEIHLNREWQPIDEVIGSALRASEPLLRAHSVATRLTPGLPIVQIDAVLIERVLCNLIENAVKYTPTGSAVTISVEADGDTMRLTVSDNGPGIPRGREDAIFDKFSRGERESAIPGVGLGLAICRALVEAHGGNIRASRAEEGGTAFIITIPLGTPPALPDPEPLASEPYHE
jgi:two-component system, OmpR family, sensor histidine kinase KdpD